jgi:WD40 repeat protein
LAAGSPAEPARWRHRLVAAGTARYENLDPDGQLPSVTSDVERVAAVLVGGFSYERATGTGLGVDPTAAEFTAGLGQWLSGMTREDVLVIYYSGHGERVTGQYYLLTRDSRPGTGITWSAFPVGQLGHMLSEASAEYVLVFVDACYAGQGALDLSVALRSAEPERPGSRPLRVWCVTATRARQEAREGAFVAALADAIPRVHAGATQQFLGLEEIVREINQLLASAGHEAQYSTFGSAGIAPFFPNAAYNAAVPPGTDLEAQRLGDFTTHWDPRSRGVEVASDPGSYFTGRRAVLGELLTWLAETPGPDADQPAVHVVTGRPGSGKSAVLARLVLLADPVLKELTGGAGPSPGGPAGGGTWISALARNKTLGALVAELAGQAGVELPGGSDPERAAALVTALAERGGAGIPVTIVIDGLDESPSAGQLADQLIVPVAGQRPPGLRLIVGTRPNLLPRLSPAHVIDLDDQEYFSERDLAGYVQRMLVAAGTPSVSTPYQSVAGTVVAQVAAEIARRAAPSFLLARLVSRTLLAAPEPVDMTDPTWTERFPATAGEAFERDLQARFPDAYERQRVQDLLTPLAFADGEGLPVANLWHAIATALSGRDYTPADVTWIQHSADSYIVEALEDGRSVYRLYHQAIADYLRSLQLNLGAPDDARPGTGLPVAALPGSRMKGAGTDGAQTRTIAQVQRPITEALIASVPAGPDGRRNWLAAHPYVLRHLGAHAAAAGYVDDLLTDAGFLVAADPDSVRHAAAAATPPLRAVGRVYRQEFHSLRDAPPWQRAQMLQLAARRGGLDWLADQVADLGLAGQWDTVLARWRREAEYQVIGRQQSPVRAVAVTALAGRPVAIAGAVNGSVVCWDMETGTQVTSLPNHEQGAWAIAVATVDGRRVAVVAGGTGTISVWDLESGALVRTLPVPGTDKYANSLDVTEAGGRVLLVSGGGDRVLRVWDLADGTCLREIAGFGAAIERVRFARLGGRLAILAGATYSGGRGHGPLTAWDPLTGQLLRTLEAKEWLAHEFTTAESGGRTHVVCAWAPGAVRVFDADTGRNARVLRYAAAGDPSGGSDYIQCIATATVDDRLMAVTGSNDGIVRLWDVADQTTPRRITGRLGRRRGPVRLLEGHTDSVSSIEVATLDGHPVAVSGDRDGVVRRWDLDEAMSPRSADHAAASSVPGFAALAMTRLAGTPVIAAVTERKNMKKNVQNWDVTVEIWDVARRAHLRTIQLPGREANYVAATESQTGPIVVSCQANGSLRAFDMSSGTEVWRGETGTFVMRGIDAAPLPGGGIAVLTHSDAPGGATRVWSTEDGGPGFYRGNVRGRVLVPLDDALALLYEEPVHVPSVPDPKLVLWDLIADRELSRLDRTLDGIVSCAVAEIDGRAILACGGYDGEIEVRDLRTGEVLRMFSGHPEMTGRLAFLAQGRSPLLVSAPYATYTGIVQAWDLGSESSDPLCTIDLGTQVTALAADPSGDHVAVGTAKGFVVLQFRPRART